MSPATLLAVSLAVTTAGSAPPALAQSGAVANTAITIDAERAGALAERAGGSIELSELLRQTASVELKSARAQLLVLYVYRLRAGRVLASYRSPSFNVAVGSAMPLLEVLATGQPPFGNLAFDPQFIRHASATVNAARAASEPARFLLNGVIPFKPKDWERMDAYYLVAAPADRQQAEAATARISVLFAVPD